jgi:hypothetical protein
MPRTHYIQKANDEELREELRELACLMMQMFGEGASKVAATRADDLRRSGNGEAAGIWDSVILEIRKLRAMEPEGRVKH